MSVMRQINEKMLDNLKYVWKGIADFEPQIESMDSNPQFNQVIATSETVALVTITVQIQETKGLINLCFPYITLDRVLSSLTAQQWFNQYQQTTYQLKKEEMKNYLGESSVEVNAKLGSTVITLEDFLHLQEGDVLQLNRKEGEPLEVFVEGRPFFLAQPGKLGKRQALQITDWIRENKEGENGTRGQ